MPKPDSPLLRRPPRTHRTDIQMRFADLDAMGHVNNVSFAVYAETARVDFVQALGDRVRSIILAHLDIDYLRPIAFGETLHVETWVARIGRTSITLRQLIWADERIAAEIGSVIVFYDYATAQSREVPPAIHTALRPYTVPAEDTPDAHASGAAS